MLYCVRASFTCSSEFLSSARFTIPRPTTEKRIRLDSAIALVAQLDDVIARLLRRQLIAQPVRADRDLLGFRDPLLQDRLVAVAAVLLLRHDRDVFLRDHVQRHVLERDPFELRIDREQIDRARRASR